VAQLPRVDARRAAEVFSVRIAAHAAAVRFAGEPDGEKHLITPDKSIFWNLSPGRAFNY